MAWLGSGPRCRTLRPLKQKLFSASPGPAQIIFQTRAAKFNLPGFFTKSSPKPWRGPSFLGENLCLQGGSSRLSKPAASLGYKTEVCIPFLIQPVGFQGIQTYTQANSLGTDAAGTEHDDRVLGSCWCHDMLQFLPAWVISVAQCHEL